MARTVLAIGLVMVVMFTGNIMAGEAYYGFIEEPTSTRALGMGSAGSALTGNGGFSFYNPALLSLHKPSVSLEFGKIYNDLGRGYLEFNYAFPKWFFGLSFQSQSITFEYADERGVKEGSEGSEQGVMASLAAGFIKERFSAGVVVNGIHHRIAKDHSNGFTFSTGAVFHIIPGNLTGGIAILHFYGRNTGLLDSTHHLHGDPLPLTGRAGLSWTDTIKDKIPYTVSSDIVYSSNYELLMVPVGIEAWILPMLAVRLGKRINHPTDVITMGIGLKLANVKYDVAFTPVRLVSDVEMKWSMNLTYELPSIKKKSGADKLPAAGSAKLSKGVSDTAMKIIDTVNIENGLEVSPVAPVIDSTGKTGSSVIDYDSTIKIDSTSITDSIGVKRLEEQLLREDTTGTVNIDLDKNSEKEISSDTVSAKADSTRATTNSGTDDEIIEVKIPNQSIGIASEKEDTINAEPADSGTVKTK